MPPRSHGLSRSRIYRCWVDMKRRCTKTSATDWHQYGEKGTTVCNRWMKFDNFYADMVLNYKDHLTLDRIDNNKNYCKSNCKWATRKEQSRNQSTNRMIKYKGKIQCLAAWVEETGIKRSILRRRLDKCNGSLEKVL